MIPSLATTDIIARTCAPESNREVGGGIGGNDVHFRVNETRSFALSIVIQAMIGKGCSKSDRQTSSAG